MKALTQKSRKFFKYSDTAVLLNPDGLITSQTGGGGWTIYRFREYGELWLMLNAQADASYPRWQTDRPNVFATFKTPKKCIITSYYTTQWCDGNNTGRICNHWQIKGYESYDDLLHLRNGVIIDDNTWPSINKGESKTVDLSTNTKGFQYYSVQMISNFTGSSYCSMGSTKFYAREAAEVSGDDYDYYEETKTYKFVNQKFNGKDIFYTPASLGIDKKFATKLAALQKVGAVKVINGYGYDFSENDYAQLDTLFPTGINKVEIKAEFITGDTVNSEQMILWQERNDVADAYFGFQTHPNSTHFYCYSYDNGIIYQNSNFTVQPNTKYVCTLKIDNGTLSWSLGEPNNLIEQTSMPFDMSVLNNITKKLLFGKTNLWDYSFKGTINFNETYIKINDTFFFRGDMLFGIKNFGILSNDYIIEKGPIDYTVVGNPTINNGILSNTSINDYVKISNFPMRSKNNWQLDIKAATVFNNSQQRAVYFPSGYLRVIGTTPTWNLYIDGHEFALSEIHLYPYARVVKENNTIYAYDSTNGINYNLRGTITNANLSDGDLTLGGGSGQPWAGTIDLNFTSIKLNGWAWFGSANLIWANDNIYLRGDGNSWVDTGLNSDTTHLLELYCSVQQVEGGKDIFFLQGGGNNNARMTIQSYSHNDLETFNSYLGYNDGVKSDWTNNNYDEKIHFKTQVDGTYYNLYKNGVNLTRDYFAYQNYQSNISYKLFKGWADISKVSIYKCNINNENGNPIRNFVPVPQGLKIGNFTVPSNGMYDMVEQKFYPNAGTGEFIYGKD